MPTPAPSRGRRDDREDSAGRAGRARRPARRPAVAHAWSAAALSLALLAAGCAHRGGPPPEDATRDPEFRRALRERDPEFATQHEALVAGLYEEFVPPESAAAAVAAPARPASIERESSGAAAVADPLAGEDPSTEELLRSLPLAPGEPPRPAGRPRERTTEGGPSNVTAPQAVWALQLGAFRSEEAAAQRAAQVRAALPGQSVRLTRGGGYVRVLLGAFPTRAEAEIELRGVEARGLGPAHLTRGAR
ncbi:MAG: SPOR domain-containing protein [Gemmatimonadota bacterium]